MGFCVSIILLVECVYTYMHNVLFATFQGQIQDFQKGVLSVLGTNYGITLYGTRYSAHTTVILDSVIRYPIQERFL